MNDQGLMYLIRSSLDESNEYIEIKSTKLKVVVKEIVPAEGERVSLPKKKTARNVMML